MRGLLARFLYEQPRCTWTCCKTHLTREFAGQMARPRNEPRVLCELARSKCRWTCHESHLMRKFAGIMPDALAAAPVLRERACAVEMHMDISQEPFCVEIYRDKAVHFDGDARFVSLRSRNGHGHFTSAIWREIYMATSIEHRALRLTGKNCQQRGAERVTGH